MMHGIMSVLVIWGIMLFATSCVMIILSAVGRPFMTSDKIEEILRKYHDDYGEFDYDKCVKEIMDRFT